MAGKEGIRGKTRERRERGQDKVKNERERQIEREGGGMKGYNNGRQKVRNNISRQRGKRKKEYL
jgi:hypothetical protein